jgi:DNA invertase Pin-like site-specific DNA recombinase
VRQVVAYLRVSTDRQGKSGLGIEAQREAVARFAAADMRGRYPNWTAHARRLEMRDAVQRTIAQEGISLWE